MARYAYDVNTTQRYIDVHKQFQGGLKTVDTDDALGAVFLREAENVSISEFGFLEKRYGTYENFKQTAGINATSKLQGYWEFEGYIIYAVDGDLFVNGTQITTFHTEAGLRYPTNDNIPFNVTSTCAFVNTGSAYSEPTEITLPIEAVADPSTSPTCGSGVTKISCVCENFVVGEGCVQWSCQDSVGTLTFTTVDHFQRTRDMNAVNINRVLYIFTGTYPLYAKVVSEELKFYLFPVTIPTFDEIVVTGHNLLEDDYEEVYFEDFTTLTNTGTGTGTFIDNYFIKEASFNPKFPFSNNDGQINFEFSYQFDSRVTLNTYPYRELHINSISYAPVGSTASDIFNLVDSRFYNFNKINTNTNVDLTFTKNKFAQSYQETVISGTAGFITFYSSVKANTTYRLRLKNGASYVNNIISTNTPNPYLAFIIDENRSIVTGFDTNNSNANYLEFKLPETYIFDGEKFLGFSFQSFDLSLIDGAELQELYILEASDSPLNASVPLQVNLKNLLSGSWDFRFNIQLRIIDSSGNITVEKELPFIIQNITVTPEKLQDYPGAIDYPKLKPIWTCNKVIEHFSKLMVWGSQEMPTAVFYSFPDRPSYFPSKFFLDFTNDQNSPVEAVSSYMNILVVQTRDQTWGIRGNSGLLTAPAPYAPFTINPTVGTIAYKSVRAVRNHLFFLSKQGIIALKSLYAADEQYNIEFVDRNILNIVPRDDDSAVGIQFDNQYWLNFPKQRITLRWYIDKKAWVKDTYGAWEAFNGVFKYQIVNGKLEFITHPSRFTGTVDTSPADGIPDNPAIYKVGVDYSLPTDLGGDIVALFETAFLNQNYPFHPKNYKETKMDFTVQNEYNSGRDPIYIMETNEHITENQGTYIHTINAPALLKNHRYNLTYSGDRVITSVQLQSTPVTFTEVDGVVTFLLPNDAPIGGDLVIQGDFENYDGGAALLDITYDHVLDFRTWIISEDKTLNLDNLDGYEQAKAEIPIELGAKFGEWVFGRSDLGNKVTAIKTIKLAGRGYNVKVYFEDYSKSKWTLESLGITFKMKRPRSR
jgi:hypothetical protein